MKYKAYFILLFLVIINMTSCVDQEKFLNDRYLALEEPHYYGDTLRMYEILKIHKKLYKKHPDNLIYFSNVYNSNCSLGKYEDNKKLIENSIIPEDPDVNSIVYRNFYLALNQYREDPQSNYQQYLLKLLDQDLDHNPLLGYIAAKCCGKDEIAAKFYPLIYDYVFEMPEKNVILKMISTDRCDRFLELYRGICPKCEICERTNFI